MKLSLHRFSFGALLVVAITGCGGGASPTLANVQELAAGPMRIQGQMNAPTVDGVPGGLSVYAFTGAITKAYWTDANPTIGETELIFGLSTLRDGDQIVACEPDGSNLRVVANLVNAASEVRASPDGVWLYFVEDNTLKRVPLAGGSVTTVLADVRSFAFTPSGARLLAYRPGSDTVVMANSDGTGVEVRLTPEQTNDVKIVGCVNESSGLFVNAPSSASPTMYRLSLVGTVFTQYYLGFVGVILYHMELHPSRDRVLSLHKVSATNRVFLMENFLRETGVSVVTTVSDVPVQLQHYPFVYSPDGNSLLTSQLVETISDDALELLLTDRFLNTLSVPFTGNVANKWALAWAPSVKFRTFVGSGNYASGAAALLFSDKAQRTPSVVLADSTNRASMTVQRVSDVNDGTLIYRLECDNLTKLHYTKSNSFSQISVVGSITGLKGAFVSFNVDTGRVSNVVTYSKRPSVAKGPNGWVLEGEDLIDVFDKDGERRPATKKVQL